MFYLCLPNTITLIKYILLLNMALLLVADKQQNIKLVLFYSLFQVQFNKNKHKFSQWNRNFINVSWIFKTLPKALFICKFIKQFVKSCRSIQYIVSVKKFKLIYLKSHYRLHYENISCLNFLQHFLGSFNNFD